MVIYGSYLGPAEDLRTGAAWTAGGDLAAGLLAGFAVLAVGWGIGRADALRELAAGAGTDRAPGFWIVLLHAWLRWVVPLAILLVALWWLAGDVLGWL